MGNKSSSKPGG